MKAIDSSNIVAEVRRRSGLTQMELASRAGTSQAAIARYESGTSSPSTATLQRITKAAGFVVHFQLKPVKASNLNSSRAVKLRRKRGEINTMLADAGASKPRIFGSVARGEDDERSDIDLLVDFDVTKGLMPIVELNSRLSKLLGERVEVSPTSILKPSVLERALAEAIPL